MTGFPSYPCDDDDPLEHPHAPTARSAYQFLQYIFIAADTAHWSIAGGPVSGTPYGVGDGWTARLWPSGSGVGCEIVHSPAAAPGDDDTRTRYPALSWASRRRSLCGCCSTVKISHAKSATANQNHREDVKANTNSSTPTTEKKSTALLR